MAYPLWDESLLADLTDEVLERLFREAALESVWEKQAKDIDNAAIPWDSTLSLGEQQRLQFCRLFWHHEWHQKHGNGRGFYAVLDESTASLDVKSEVAVYSECRKRGMGFLSVAHRPTVIKFHDEVLTYYFDENAELQYKIDKSEDMAKLVSEQIRGSGST